MVMTVVVTVVVRVVMEVVATVVVTVVAAVVMTVPCPSLECRRTFRTLHPGSAIAAGRVCHV
jgi:hypothetical protein